MSYSVILPTYNEEGHIIDLIKQISKVLKKQTSSYEIIVVDDSSTDGTQYLVKRYLKKFFFLRLVIRKKKKNLAESINEGIKKSKYKYVIWLDADFQHPPKFISNLIKKINYADSIICSRFLKKSQRYFMKVGNNKNINENQSIFFNKICNLFLFSDITDYTSGFICLKKTIINKYKLHGYYGEYFLNLVCYLKKNKKKILEIPFDDDIRASGKSKTIDNFNIKYTYTCFQYFLSLITNIIKLYFQKLINL